MINGIRYGKIHEWSKKRLLYLYVTMDINKIIRWKLFFCLENIDTELCLDNSSKKKSVKQAHLQVVNVFIWSMTRLCTLVWSVIGIKKLKKNHFLIALIELYEMIGKAAIDTRLFGNVEETFRVWTKFKLTWNLLPSLFWSISLMLFERVWEIVWTENGDPSAVLTHYY